jgi:hypothetical protein
MILTPGQLYFINEQDTQTGMRSSYYKIGIVRDADGRDSKIRLLEHQTGNPRKLVIVETLSMPAVEAVETTLHYLFARNRVMGEWMSFTSTELAQAISKAKDLATEIKSNLEDFARAEELKSIPSNGVLREPSDLAEKLHTEAIKFKEIISRCDDVIDRYKQYLYQAIERGVDIGNKAELQAKSGSKKFDEKLFMQNYPDLAEKYSVMSLSIKGSFRLKPSKNLDFGNSVIDLDRVELISDFKGRLSGADHSLETGFYLHDKHLAALETKKFAEWKSDIALAKLKVLTDQAEGIEGICSWKREEKQSISLDKKKLQVNHPDEYKSCIVQGADTEALIVKPRIAEVR